MLYFALYIVTWVDEDARARLLQQLDEEAEGRGGRGGKALGELEDQLRSELPPPVRRDQRRLKEFKKASEEERTARTSQLVEAQQPAEAAIESLGSGGGRRSRSCSRTEVIVSEGDKAGKAALTTLRKAAADEIERVNGDIQQREAEEEASAKRRIDDLRLQMDATLEAERDRLRNEAEGLREEIRKAKDEIARLQTGHAAARDRRSTAGATASWTASTAPACVVRPACSAPAWAQRRCAS